MGSVGCHQAFPARMCRAGVVIESERSERCGDEKKERALSLRMVMRRRERDRRGVAPGVERCLVFQDDVPGVFC